jgi:N-acetylated-alpha-linked acidic dipeptidase
VRIARYPHRNELDCSLFRGPVPTAEAVERDPEEVRPMNMRRPLAFCFLLALAPVPSRAQSVPPLAAPVFGYADFGREACIEARFLAVPSAKLAGQHLKALTAEPHRASTPQDRKTAEYIARMFRQAGLETEIVPYRVLLNQPKAERLEVYSASGQLLLAGPTREHVDGDAYQDNPGVEMPFHGSAGSGDVTAQVVYANYGRREDFDLLAARHIDVRGKIVLARYGAIFRGVKVYLAEQRGAAAVLLYSDPEDDGYSKGDTYPEGPWRPETSVQSGSVQYLFKYPGDPETPGVASTLDLPDSARIPARRSGNQPLIPSIPLSYHDAAPILKNLKGPGAPQGWQGALPFRYHLGPGGVRVHLVSQQDYQRRVIWDVIGRIKGAEFPDEWVIAGNHHDAWFYGAADPSSGTAAMLESVRGIGVLLRQGWRPKRSMIFASWDAEEEGLIGSTEWVEQHAGTTENAVAYFNMDVGVCGPDFIASAVPSLKQFLREVTGSVLSPLGGSVYRQWRISELGHSERNDISTPAVAEDEPHVGVLGSGSDFTPFLQHEGVPSTDIASEGPYGVYHSVFDNFAWYTQNADPHFLYLQEMARVFGLEALRMADADVLPYDYVAYAREIAGYLAAARRKALDAGMEALDFGPAQAAASHFFAAAERVHRLQTTPSGDLDKLDKLNKALRRAEIALLSENGLPNRPWYRHTIYAPGEFTGYAAMVIPGVNEALDARGENRAAQQLNVLAHALDGAARTLDAAP